MSYRTEALREFARFVLEDATDRDLDAIATDLRWAVRMVELGFDNDPTADPDLQEATTSAAVTLRAMIAPAMWKAAS